MPPACCQLLPKFDGQWLREQIALEEQLIEDLVVLLFIQNEGVGFGSHGQRFGKWGLVSLPFLLTNMLQCASAYVCLNHCVTYKQ